MHFKLARKLGTQLNVCKLFSSFPRSPLTDKVSLSSYWVTIYAILFSWDRNVIHSQFSGKQETSALCASNPFLLNSYTRVNSEKQETLTIFFFKFALSTVDNVFPNLVCFFIIEYSVSDIWFFQFKSSVQSQSICYLLVYWHQYLANLVPMATCERVLMLYCPCSAQAVF